MSIGILARLALAASVAISLQGCCEARCSGGGVHFTRSFPLNPEPASTFTLRVCRNDQCDVGVIRPESACSLCEPGHQACEATCGDSTFLSCAFSEGMCEFGVRGGQATLVLELAEPGLAVDGDRWRIELVEDGTGARVLFVERDVTYGRFEVCGSECASATL